MLYLAREASINFAFFSLATSDMTSFTSSSEDSDITGTPSLIIPALASAILASVSPSISTWSNPICVITETRGFKMTFVISILPPIPVSRITISGNRSLKYSKAVDVSISNSEKYPYPSSLTCSAKDITYVAILQKSSSLI